MSDDEDDDDDTGAELLPPERASLSQGRQSLVPVRGSLKNRLSASKAQNDPKHTRHLSLFGAGFSAPNNTGGIQKPRSSVFSQGNTLSPVPVGKRTSEVSQQSSQSGNVGTRRGKHSSATLWGGSAFQPDGKPYSATQTQKRRRSWLARRQIKFESASGRPEPEDNLKVFLDDLAKKRTQESSKQHRVEKDEAILHHRDSLLGAAMFARRKQHVEMDAEADSTIPRSLKSRSPAVGSTATAGIRQSVGHPQVDAPVAATNSIIRALKKLSIFANCSEEFFGLLSSQGETFRLNSGESREVSGARKGLSLRARLACAVVVVSGSCRVEVGRRIISECSPGSAYGLANVLAGVSQGRTNSSGQQAVDHFTIRPSGFDGCYCLILTATLLRQTLAHCHHDQSQLQEVLHILNQPVDSTRQLLSTLQCSETLKQAVIDGSTRHLFLRGEAICKETEDRPFGLILLRCGVVSIEINGVEVRKVNGCCTIGEEMLCNISPAWGFSAMCVTHCDVQILHRHLFLPLLRDMQSGDTEDRSASQRLMYIVDGNWKENKAILSWPLFRGYDVALLTRLGHHLETRVVLAGRKIWEGGPNGFEASGTESALYFLLVGSCDETYYVERDPEDFQENISASDLRKIRRNLVQGACIGSKEFLGCREKFASTVIAKTISLLVVLHRSVFLHVLDGLSNEEKKMQSSEVAHILQEQVDQADPKSYGFSELVNHIPLLNFSDIMCLKRLADLAVRLFCIPGQNLCQRGSDMDALFLISRGIVTMKLADLEIKRYTSGDLLSALSLCVHGFIPSYALICGVVCEVWSLHRQDTLRVLDSFPSEKARLNTLIKAQLREPTKEEEEEAKAHGFLVPVPNLKIFQGCSMGLMQWIANHLEIRAYFPKQVIVSEEEEEKEVCGDTSFYAICEGQVIGFSNSENVQVSLVSGNYFGEMRLLGISERVDTSMQAMEITILQVLHQSVFKRSLELFPEDVQHFEKVMLAGIAEQETLHLSSVPFFAGCNKEFCREVERLMVTKLVQKGGVIVEKGSNANDYLYILRTGSATSDPNDALPQNPAAEGSCQSRTKGAATKPEAPCNLSVGSVVNMDTVLGMQRNVQRTMRAITPCAVVQISAVPFLHALQRFPSEITKLLCRCEMEAGGNGGKGGGGGVVVTGGGGGGGGGVVVPGVKGKGGKKGGVEKKDESHMHLWPKLPSAVPLLKGISIGLFEILMSISEWHMFLPEQYILRQGQKGKIMYILCHGEAAIEAEGICIEEASVGYCFGHRNFLGVSVCYEESLRTLRVSHFRRLEAEELDKHIHDVPGEVDRLQQLRLSVRQSAGEESKIRQQKMWNEKLRRRKIIAFRSHISTVRSTRGFPHPFQVAAPCADDETKEKEKEPREEPDERDHVKSDASNVIASNHGSLPASRRSSFNDGFSADWVSLDTKTKQINSVRNSIFSARNSCVPDLADTRSSRTVRPSTFMTAHAFKVASFMQRMKEKNNRYPDRVQSPEFGSDESSNDSDSAQSSNSDNRSEMWSQSRTNSVSTSGLLSARNSTSRHASVCGPELALRKASRASLQIGNLAEADPQKRNSLQKITEQRRVGGVAAYLPGMMGSLTEERRVSILAPSGYSGKQSKVEAKQRGSSVIMENDTPRNRRRTPPGRKSMMLPRKSTVDECDGFSDVSSESSNVETPKTNKSLQSSKRGTNSLKVTKTDSDGSFEISVLAPQDFESDGRDSLGGEMVEKMFFAKMQAFNQSKPLTKTERIETAISTHNVGRWQQIERGKVLRALQNGRFPPLPLDAEYDPREIYLEHAHEKEFRIPGFKMPGNALHEKFKQLTTPTSRAWVSTERGVAT